MTVFHGKDGRVYWDTQDDGDLSARLSHVTSWSVDISYDTAECTAMGESNGWKAYTSGFKGWTGTVEAFLDTDGLDIPLETEGDLAGLGETLDSDGITPVAMEFWFGDSVADGYLTGDCICTGIGVSVSKDDNVTVTYTIQGVGAIEFDDE